MLFYRTVVEELKRAKQQSMYMSYERCVVEEGGGSGKGNVSSTDLELDGWSFVVVRRPTTEGVTGAPRVQGERQVGVWPVLSKFQVPDSGGACCVRVCHFGSLGPWRVNGCASR